MNRARRWLGLAVVATLTATAGCAADDPPFTDHGTAVVSVVASGCSLEPVVGAGVAIDHAGALLVLTTAHTVAGASSISLGPTAELGAPIERSA